MTLVTGGHFHFRGWPDARDPGDPEGEDDLERQSGPEQPLLVGHALQVDLVDEHVDVVSHAFICFCNW